MPLMVIAATLIGACQAAPPTSQGPKGLLTISREGNTTFNRNFNPFSPAALWPTVYAMYDPMLIYNAATGKTIPRLATDWKWATDGKSLTFNTRANVKWSDGKPFTARDVAFTFGLENKIFGEGLYDYIDTVKAQDDRTVLFTLKRTYSPSLYEIGRQVIVPEHIWKDVSEPAKFTNPDPVATGPFTNVQNFQSQVYEVHRNPNYWEPGKPYIEGVRVPAYPGNDQANLATINGENDWADQFIPEVDKTFVSKDSAHRYYWFPKLNGPAQLYVLTLKKPFDDPNVRKAISMAIDRDQINRVAMNGYVQPAAANGIGPRYSQWINQASVQNGTWTKLNVAKANDLLDAAGLKRGSDGVRRLPDGTPMKYSVIVGASSTDWVASCQVISQNLKQVGIDVSVKGQDWGAVIDQMQKGQFEMAHAWSSQGPTPYDFFRGAMSSQTQKPVGQMTNENYQRYADPRADELLKQFAATFDVNQQQQIANKLQDLYVEDAPGIPLMWWPSWGEFNTTRFTGFPSQDNPYAESETRTPTTALVLTTVKPRS
jgi:peptide/nickel transport system substrate-binding protein